MQIVTTFFTGGFRRPRRAGWVLLFAIFIVALLGGWSGYALPDDMLSGTGLRITEGIALSIPFVGTGLAHLLFGGQYPGEIIAHLYPIHVAVVPALLLLLLPVRGWLSFSRRPPQFAGAGRTEDNVIGIPLLPNAAARAVGLFTLVGAVILLISATVTVNPVWLYGPASPGDASAGSQPDWYTGFLDGALRLVPPGWEIEWLGRTWTLAILIPLIVVGVFLTLVATYPFIEEWITGDHREHHLLDRPRNTPTRTAIGVTALAFYGVLWGAGSADIVTTQFHLPLELVVTFFQLALLIVPPLAFMLTRRVCLALRKRDREVVLHGYETGRIVRLPGGEYVEIHAPLDDYERWRLVDVPDYAPLELRPDEDGRVTIAQRIRWRLSRLFFEDRISPVTLAELGETIAETSASRHASSTY
jgi:ubiquinol-cytochrome c reductase cytochrome b subunit